MSETHIEIQEFLLSCLLRDTQIGNIHPKSISRMLRIVLRGRGLIINEETKINVLKIEVAKTVSLREVGQVLQISHGLASKILKRYGYRAFK